MKAAARTKTARVSKRDLFGELSEGMTALAEVRRRKRTLPTHCARFKPAVDVAF